MKSKYIFSIFLIWTMGWVACQKEDEPEMERNIKNLFRVKEISGTNPTLGEFRLQCGYVNEKLDSMVLYDREGKVRGRLVALYAGSKADFYWYDYVVSVDADSAAKLEPDSVPRVLQIRTHWNYQLSGNLIQQEIITAYGPRAPAPDAEFDYTYEVKSEMKYLYEYAPSGRLLYLRTMNLNDPNQPPHKYEFSYKQNRNTGYIEYVYQTDSWIPGYKMDYEWSDDRIKAMVESVMNGDWQLRQKSEFSWQGAYPARLSSDEKSIEYAYDIHGNLSGIRTGEEEYKMTYENGHGNFDWFRMPENLFTMAPVIK